MKQIVLYCVWRFIQSVKRLKTKGWSSWKKSLWRWAVTSPLPWVPTLLVYPVDISPHGLTSQFLKGNHPLSLSVSFYTHTHTHTPTHTHTIASSENFDWYKWLQIHKEKRDTVLKLEIQKLETHIFAEILLVGIREKRKQAWILHLGMMPFPEMGRGRDERVPCNCHLSRNSEGWKLKFA